MFKKVTRYIVSQMDPNKELVPVESLADHEHFRPSCLLIEKKRRKTIFHQGPYYQCTGFKLDDVLLPEDDGNSAESLLPSGDGPDSRQFTLTNVTADKVKGNLNITVDPASVELNGGGSVSQEFSIKLQKLAVPKNSLEALRKRKINTDHSFIQQLQGRKVRLFLVYKSLEASEETVYKESTKAHGGFLARIYAKFSAKGTTENRQSIVIPEGCTLAFRAIQVNLTKREFDLVHFEEEGSSVSSALVAGSSQVVREVLQQYGFFSKLSSDLQVMFVNIITAVMKDSSLFQELSQKMERSLEKTHGSELKTESPELKDPLSTLENSPRDHPLLQAEGITHTLDGSLVGK